MGLTEVMVSISLIAGAAYYMAQNARQSMRTARKIDSLGESEGLRQTLRLGVDCNRSFQGFPTASGFPAACHSGAGPLQLLRGNGTAIVGVPQGVLGEYDLRATCPGPGPAGCGCAAPTCVPCGAGPKIEYRNRLRASEGDWKDLFGINPPPCASYFGAGAPGTSAVTMTQGAQNVPAPTCTGVNVGGLCSGPFAADIVFPTPFISPPMVLVSAAIVSNQGGCVGNATDHLRTYAVNITNAGFRMLCSGSPESGSCGAYEGWFTRATCSWIAVGR